MTRPTRLGLLVLVEGRRTRRFCTIWMGGQRIDDLAIDRLTADAPGVARKRGTGLGPPTPTDTKMSRLGGETRVFGTS